MSNPALHPDATLLFSKNITFFEKKHPNIAKRISAHPVSDSAIIFDDYGKPINISLGQVNLYGKDSKEYVDFQIENFREHPTRLAYPNPNHCNINHTSFGLFRLMQDYILQHEDRNEWLDNLQVVDIGYFFCFGLGLGDHIEKLLDEYKTNTFIITEPVWDFFVHSLYNLDWTEISEKAEKQDTNLIFCLGESVEATVLQIEKIISAYGITFLEGSYFYIHYPSWENEKALDRLKGRMDSFSISSGFFEDEIDMCSNTYANMRRERFTYIKAQRVLHQDMPAFIVASGPSLERNIQHIKKWRDHVVLFSAGSTLKILLQNGIRPDIHIENENVPQVFSILKGLNEQYGLQGITLCASATIYPGVASFFDNVWFYSRPGLSSTSIFASADDALHDTGPLVANSASALAVASGFRNIYLFGVDCGKLPGKATHHKDTVYNEDEALLGMSATDFDDMFNRRVPGNFGGEILTSRFHDMSRLAFNSLSARTKMQIYNCSYGAALDGIPPLSSARIALTNTPGQQKQVLERIQNQFITYEPKTFITAERIQTMVDDADAFKESMRNALDELIETTDNFTSIDKALDTYWIENLEKHRGYMTMTAGTYSTMIRLASFLGSRIKKDDIRKAFIKHTMYKFLEICDWMADRTQDIFIQMKEDHASIASVAPYEGGFDKVQDVSLDADLQAEVEAYLKEI